MENWTFEINGVKYRPYKIQGKNEAAHNRLRGVLANEVNRRGLSSVDIVEEFDRIQDKKSTLSSRERKLICACFRSRYIIAI